MYRWLRSCLLASPLFLCFHSQTTTSAGAQEEPLKVVTLANAQTQEALAAVAAGKRATALVDTPDSTGSAFCIDPAGIFVTNDHVVEGLARVKVITNPGTPNQQILIARVSHADRANDLAVLVAETAPDPRFPLTALPLGDSNGLVETTPVAVFGFPFGLGLALNERDMPDVTVTTGRVTSLRRLQGQLKEIQLDAAVNPGNSGGPVINVKGEVVGIVRAQIEFAQGVNFAIPVNVVRGLLSVPEIRFGPAPVEWSKRSEVQNWTIDIVPFPAFGGEAPGQAREYSMSLAVGSGEKWRDLTITPVPGNGAGSFQFQATGSLYAEGASTPRALKYRLILQRNGRTLATREGLVPMNGAPPAPLFPQPRDKGGPQENGPILQNPANGHWYQLVVPEEDVDWEGAKVAAAAMKYQGLAGHLVTFNSADEAKFISSVVLGKWAVSWVRAWAGGFQKPDSKEPDGAWEWVTGEPWKYTNWAPGEPNEVGGEDHLQLDQTGAWNDARGADFNITFIVEFEPPIQIPATPLTVDAPVVEDGKTVINLPAPATDSVAAGGGRYILFYLKSEQKVAVLDTQEKKIARYIAAPGDKVLMAAGQEKLVLLLTDQNILQRWDLKTGVREQSAPLDDDQAVISIAMGSVSAGPLMALKASKPVFFDLATLKPIAMLDAATGNAYALPAVDNGGKFGGANASSSAGASADGTAFAISNTERNSQRWLLERNGNRLSSYPLTDVNDDIYPSFDGRWWFSRSGIFTGEGKPVTAEQLRLNGRNSAFQFMVPALHPSYFVALKSQDAARPGGGRIGGRDGKQPLNVSIYSANDRRLLVELGPLDELSYEFSRALSVQGLPQPFPIEKRVYFLPDRNLLVTVGGSHDQLVIRPLSLTEVLSKQGKKYLFVSSLPPRRVIKGADFKYQLKVEALNGVAKYSVENGPTGLTISPTGLVQWKVPANQVEVEVPVLIAITDKAGQELYHSFRLQIKGQ